MSCKQQRDKHPPKPPEKAGTNGGGELASTPKISERCEQGVSVWLSCTSRDPIDEYEATDDERKRERLTATDGELKCKSHRLFRTPF